MGSYRDQGILPEALVNFLALLGWTPPGGEEILSCESMTQQFDLAAVSKSNAVFDPEKLAWMNSQYLRALSMDRLAPLVETECGRSGFHNHSFAREVRANDQSAPDTHANSEGFFPGWTRFLYG